LPEIGAKAEPRYLLSLLPAPVIAVTLVALVSGSTIKTESTFLGTAYSFPEAPRAGT
jgi:hypothetical protein